MQLITADVVDRPKGADYYRRKHDVRKQEFVDEYMMNADVGDDETSYEYRNKMFAARKLAQTSVPWGTRGCTVLLKCRAETTGEHILLKLKGFKPWFYVIDFDSSYDIPDGETNQDVLDPGGTTRNAILDILWENDKIRRYLESSGGLQYSFEIIAERRQLADGCQPNPADGGATIRKYTVYQVLCPTVYSRKIAVETISARQNVFKCNWGLAEHNPKIRPLIQFYAKMKMGPLSWIGVNTEHRHVKLYNDKHPSKLSYKAREFKCPLHPDVFHVQHDRTDMAPLRAIVMDVEAQSLTGTFPDPEKSDNYTIIIGVQQKIYNAPAGSELERENNRGIQFVLGSTVSTNDFNETVSDPTEGAAPTEQFEIRNVDTEVDLLMAYRNYLVHEFDPDIIMHWNGTGFDNNYLSKRAIAATKDNGESWHMFSTLKTSKVSLEAKKNGKFVWTDLFGRLDLDLMVAVQKDGSESFRKYSLDFVAEQMFSMNKVDLTPAQLWRNHDAGPYGRYLNAMYCARDCALPLKIEDKKQIVGSLTQMAAVTYTEMSDLVYRGQTLKIYNSMHVAAHHMGYVVNYDDSIPQPKGYQGAEVIDPCKGVHTEPVPVLDFMSLYPSLMMSHNLCYSTGLVRPAGVHIGFENGELQDASIALFREMFPNAILDCPKIECAGGIIYAPVFYQNVEGLLPKMLRDLLRNRSVAKKSMAAAYAEGDLAKAAVFNGRQLAFKTSANSIYGYTGAPLSQMPRIAISSTVTYYGRMGLNQTKDYVSAKYTAYYCYVVVLGMPCVPPEIIAYYGGNPDLNGTDIRAEVIGGDTDSIFTKFPMLPTREGLVQAIKVAKVAADDCTDALFKKPMELEYEKTYWPVVFKKKKKYSAGLYVNGGDKEWPDRFELSQVKQWKPFIEAKGDETKRRSASPFLSSLMLSVFYYFFIKRDIKSAYAHVDAELTRFYERRVSPKELMITTLLKTEESYNNPKMVPHLQVALRMRKRNPGSEPKPGDRVSYVFVERTGAEILEAMLASDKKSTKFEMQTADRAEDLDYVIANKIPLDLDYYFHHQFYNPIESFFVHINPDLTRFILDSWSSRIKAVSNVSGRPVRKLDMSLFSAMPVAKKPRLCSQDKDDKEQKKQDNDVVLSSSIQVGIDFSSLTKANRDAINAREISMKDRKATVSAQQHNISCLFRPSATQITATPIIGVLVPQETPKVTRKPTAAPKQRDISFLIRRAQKITPTGSVDLDDAKTDRAVHK